MKRAAEQQRDVCPRLFSLCDLLPFPPQPGAPCPPSLSCTPQPFLLIGFLFLLHIARGDATPKHRSGALAWMLAAPSPSGSWVSGWARLKLANALALSLARRAAPKACVAMPICPKGLAGGRALCFLSKGLLWMLSPPSSLARGRVPQNPALPEDRGSSPAESCAGPDLILQAVRAFALLLMGGKVILTFFKWRKITMQSAAPAAAPTCAASTCCCQRELARPAPITNTLALPPASPRCQLARSGRRGGRGRHARAFPVIGSARVAESTALSVCSCRGSRAPGALASLGVSNIPPSCAGRGGRKFG